MSAITSGSRPSVDAPGDHLDRLSGLLVPIAIFLVPATSRMMAKQVSLALSLVPYVLLIVVAIVSIRRLDLRRNPAYLAAWLMTPIMLASMLASGTTVGMAVAISAFCGAGVALASARWTNASLARRITVPLLATSAIQAIVVIAQTVTERAVVLNWFVPSIELRVIDGLLRAQGTMSHVYEPPALALLAVGAAFATRPPGRHWMPLWVAGAALAGSTVGLTHSRAALFSLILIVPFVVLAARRDNRHVLRVGAGFIAGFVIAALLTSSAWMHRAEHTTSGGFDDASLGRMTLARQAVELAVDHPLLGVGPGRYLTVLESDYSLDERYPYIVHNVSLAVAAELGIPAAILLSILVGWAVVRAIRSDLEGGALAVSILGFVMFDAIHYDRGVGIIMFGIWLALLQHHQDSTSRRVKSE